MTTPPRVEIPEAKRSSTETRRWFRFRSRRGPLIAVCVVAGLIAAVVGGLAWLRNANALPDVGDPFDVAAALRPIELPGSQNAYAVYATLGRFRWPKGLSKLDYYRLTWSKADPAVRTFIDQQRPALEVWREGSERPDALYHQSKDFAPDTLLSITQSTRARTKLAGVEGSRLEEQGELDEAWTWYRAMLRCGRHVGRHGGLIERAVGAAVHKHATMRIVHWAADPRVDAGSLRKALDDVLAADALTPPVSEALKLEYLMYQRDLDEMRVMVREVPLPGGKNGFLDGAASKLGVRDAAARTWLRASGDAEQSRRALKLYFANLLAQVDRPIAKRAPIAVRTPVLIYAPDPKAPPAANAVAPEVLARAIEHTALGRSIFQLDDMNYRPYEADRFLGPNGGMARERKQRSALIVRLAAELYRREHGHFPENAGKLLDGTLKTLPAGIGPNDPVPSALP